MSDATVRRLLSLVDKLVSEDSPPFQAVVRRR